MDMNQMPASTVGLNRGEQLPTPALPVNKPIRRNIMLRWALSFLVLALIAGFLGFGGVAVISIEIARILFVAFIILFVIAFAMHALQGKAPPV